MCVVLLSLILIHVITSDSSSRPWYLMMLVFFARLTETISIVPNFPLLFSMLISWFNVLAVISRLLQWSSVAVFIITSVSFFLNLELLSFILLSA